MAFIKTLQNKSESAKRTIMWIGIIFIMFVIFIFWVSTFQWSVLAPENGEADINLNKIPGVWQSLKDQLGNLGKISPTLGGFIPKFKDNQ